MTRGRRKLTPREQHDVLLRYKAGEKLRAIADRYGVDTAYPTKLAGRFGLESRMYKRRLAPMRP